MVQILGVTANSSERIIPVSSVSAIVHGPTPPFLRKPNQAYTGCPV